MTQVELEQFHRYRKEQGREMAVENQDYQMPF